MGLLARKIKTSLEEHASACEANLNKLLGTKFSFEYNWSCLPENIDGWNWDNEDLARCFYNSYFKPLEHTFSKLFKDKMYKDAVVQQVKKISFEPGRSGCADYDFKPGCFVVKHTLGPNQRDDITSFLKSAERAIEDVINTKLT